MIADQQTHSLPADAEELRRVAALMGFADTRRFRRCADQGARLRSRPITRRCSRSCPSCARGPRIVFQGDENDPDAIAALERLGFHNPPEAMAAIRAWQSGRYPATRSTQARERLTEFLPHLLDAFGRTAEPDLALATFDRVIAEMPAGLPLFSLLAANPSLLRLVADIMGTAPRLAQIIGRRPRLLDAVLDPGFFGAVPTQARLKELVKAALDQARRLSRTRSTARASSAASRRFLIGVRVLSGTISAGQAGAAYAALAETLIEALAATVEAELVRQHGRVPGGQAAVVAMGKLGGREMTAASDLDLIVVYDFAEGAQSDGPKSLTGSQYYTRFTQRLISALSAPTAEGSLYQVDMRLRPSGNQGPVATKLSSFVDYQRKSAWTWEHLALTRARVISGPPALRRAIGDTIREVLARPRDRAAVAADVRAMRAKIEAEKGTQDIWDLKHTPGGLIDAEFLTQFLELVSAHAHPQVLDQNTAGALSKLVEARVIGLAEAERLVPAVDLYNALTQCLRLCLDKPFVPDEAPRALKDLLARAADMPDFATLEVTLKNSLAAVKEAFDRLVA